MSRRNNEWWPTGAAGSTVGATGPITPLAPGVGATGLTKSPDWDGVDGGLGYGDGMTFGGPGSCVWCGSTGAHKPDCKALASNYPRGSSLQVQREMTNRMRDEMDNPYRSEAPARRPVTTNSPAVVADTRTEIQKRFDAIAEELEDGKEK